MQIIDFRKKNTKKNNIFINQILQKEYFLDLLQHKEVRSKTKHQFAQSKKIVCPTRSACVPDDANSVSCGVARHIYTNMIGLSRL